MDQTKRRIPIIAFVTSVIFPGFGHVYNGHLWQGILFFFGYWLLIFVGLKGLVFGLSGLICLIAAAIIYPIVIATRAAIEAARLKRVHLKWYNKWYLYVCAWLLIGLGFESGIPFMQYDIVGVRAFRVPANSMAPTLEKGDHFVAGLGIYGERLPSRGDIVLFPYPEDTSKTFVKRVIGLPGERVQIKDKVVFINDRAPDDPWGVYKTNVTISKNVSPRDNFGPKQIPEGEVFVLGDNRDFSQDSRFWDNVRIKDIQGKALFIYWSEDWDRIGKQLQ